MAEAGQPENMILIEADLSEEIADLLGHVSLDTTRIYTKSSFRELEQAVERIEEEP